MNTLLVNSKNEYYTRYYAGGCFTIHFEKCSEFESYLKSHNIKNGSTLPYDWKSKTYKWQYTHNLSHQNFCESNIGELYNSKCPICNKNVFYYENDNGSKVFFECAGYPWDKHLCIIHNDFNIETEKFKTITNKNEKIYQSKISKINYNGKYANIYFSNATHFIAKTKNKELINHIKNNENSIFVIKIKIDKLLNKTIYLSNFKLSKEYQCEYVESSKNKKYKHIKKDIRTNICVFCFKEFSTLDGLYSHILHKHKDNQEALNAIPPHFKINKKNKTDCANKRYKCPYCNSKLKGIQSFDEHLRWSHKDEIDESKIHPEIKRELQEYRKKRFKKRAAKIES